MSPDLFGRGFFLELQRLKARFMRSMLAVCLKAYP